MNKFKIKVKVAPHLERNIRAHVDNLEKAYLRNIEDFERSQKALKSRIDQIKKFWAKNNKPVRDWTNRIQRNLKNCYETERIYEKTGEINTSTLEENSEWVCKFCHRDVDSKFVSYGDPRYDERFYVCDCVGAKKTGKHYDEIE